jgi:hypothetical protein
LETNVQLETVCAAKVWNSSYAQNREKQTAEFGSGFDQVGARKQVASAMEIELRTAKGMGGQDAPDFGVDMVGSPSTRTSTSS